MTKSNKKSLKKKIQKKPARKEVNPLENPELQLIRGKDFLLAFEVEFVYNAELIDAVKMQRKLSRMQRGTIVGRDGSINMSHRFRLEATAEIKTPPLPPFEALRLLKKVFDFVKQYGYTNSSCGLHLNFSPVSDELYYSLNPFTFTAEPIWEEITKEFRREGNNYCRQVWNTKPKNLLEIWSRMVYNRDVSCGHYNVVNLEHYGTTRGITSRIEIRGFGNREYHKRFNRIVDYSERIFKVFLKNCAPITKPEEKANPEANGVSVGEVNPQQQTSNAVISV